MDCSVKLVAYNTKEIYRAVYEPALGPVYIVPSSRRFSTLFLDSTLIDECKNPVDNVYTSLWFRGYIGEYRNPRFSTNLLTLENNAWENDQFCIDYGSCPFGFDVSIICGFDVSVPYHNEAVFSLYNSGGRWAFGQYLGNKYLSNDIMRIAPTSNNTGIFIDTSLVFIVSNIDAAGNSYQNPPENAVFSLYQSGAGAGVDVRIDIDPDNKSDLDWWSGTVGVMSAYDNVINCSFNLTNPQYDVSEYMTINWKAIKVLPASENMGSGSFVYYNEQLRAESLYLSNIAIDGDQIWVYLSCDPLLFTDKSEYNFTKGGGDVSISVTTSLLNRWVAAEPYTWISLTNNSSTGDGLFIISVQQQANGNEQRTGYVCIDSSAAPNCITITQDASIPILIYRLYEGPGAFEYSTSWTHEQYGTEYVNASFGFDSSRNDVYYDASIVSFPSWISFSYPVWQVGDNISPYASDSEGIMKPYPISENTSTNARTGVIVVANDKGGYEEWSVYQSGIPVAPPPLTFNVDISMIGDGWEDTTYNLAGSNSYITMRPNWSYVLKVTNPSTNTIIFPVGSTISVRATSQYDIITPDFFDIDHTLPESILAGQTWETNSTISIPVPWQSGYFSEEDIESLWNVNEWLPRAYYNSIPYVDELVDTAYNTLLRRPILTLNPTTRTFAKTGGTQLVTVTSDTTGISWIASESLSWISLSGASGTGNGSFTINCEQQLSIGPERSGNISVTSLANTVYVSVTQDASQFSIPTLSTPVINSYNYNSATITHTVTSDGGTAITARGLCWNTFSPPTSCSPFGSGTGSVQSTITSLTGSEVGVTYYVRAYATNSMGTAYSSVVSFTLYGLPVLTTLAASNILGTTAQSGGNITSQSGSAITSKGICWSKSGVPSLNFADGSTFSATSGIGVFGSNMTSLDMSTHYYVRAYATNAMGLSYGNTVEFNTLRTPTIVTTSISNIGGTTAQSGGQSINTYGGTVIRKGICWSTSINPTPASPNYTIETSDAGAFTGYLAGLTNGTHYYVRAYVTTNVDTGFGQNVEFNTLSVPVVTTTAISGISQTYASSGGNVTSAGGGTVTARGVCWSTSTNPTTALSTKTSDGAGTGIFTSSMSPLTPGTTFYVRAYATNAAGTGYGANVTFSTLSIVVPTVVLSVVSDITSSGATCNSNVSNSGGASVSAKGVCWSLSQNPTVSDSKTIDGTGTGSFVSSIMGLNPGTIYYVRAYATNSAGTGYSNQSSFATDTVPSPPTVQTLAPSNIASSSATVNGNISWEGTSAVTTRGVCYSSTNQDPDLTDSYISLGSGTGLFSGTISGLTVGVTYYVRAYAANSVGVSYGSQMSFTTVATIPTITTYGISNATSTTATGGGNVTDSGGATVTARGVCWSVSSNPTTANYKTTNGSGTGSFTSSLTGLSASTTYYVRAYATNSAGTAYGLQTSFATSSAVSIQTDVNYLEVPYNSLAYTEYCAVNVTPDTLTTTITKVDSGDGTTWIGTISPTGETGDYSFRARTSQMNNTGLDRSMILRISGNGASKDVIVTQLAAPI